MSVSRTAFSIRHDHDYLRLVIKKRLGLRFSPPLAAVASDLRDHSRNNDDPRQVAPAPADTIPVHHSPPSAPPPITSTLQL